MGAPVWKEPLDRSRFGGRSCRGEEEVCGRAAGMVVGTMMGEV